MNFSKLNKQVNEAVNSAKKAINDLIDIAHINVQMVRESLPKYLKSNVSDELIQKVLDEHKDFIVSHPERNCWYFQKYEERDYHNRTYSDIVRILDSLSSELYFDECHNRNAYGSKEINYLLKHEGIPYDIVKFYVMNFNGGGKELDIIRKRYGITTIKIN